MGNTEDTFRQQGLRKKLIDELRKKGIKDERVLTAIMNVPRHYFLESALEQFAYDDRAFPIGEGQTISQPYTVAFQSELLEIKRNDKVLEIGTGSAYQAVVLAELGAKVHTIERHKSLYEKSRSFVKKYFKNKYLSLQFFLGDGFKGLATFAPFDKIIVTAAAPEIPEALIQQLKTGGKLVIPVNEDGNEDVQRMKRVTKKEDGSLEIEEFSQFQFVPMLGGTNMKVTGSH